jgi:hypothetical protein
VAKLAVVLWVGGVALKGGIDPATINGFGTLLVGVAAVIAAFAGLRNGRKINAADAKAAVAASNAYEAAENTATVVRTLGPENGKTLREILDQQNAVLAETHLAVEKVVEFHEYQRTRNHDVLDKLSELSVSVPLLAELCGRLLDKLNEEESR